MDLWTLSDLCTPWCVHVVATLRVADHIEAGTAEIGPLASASGADRDSLYRVMRHLVSKGLFTEPAPGRFALNDLARGLLGESGRVGFDLDAIGGRMAHAWGTLLSAVRTGKPAYHEVFGRGFWEDLDANPAVAASFDALMGLAGHGVPDWQVLVDPTGWETIRTVVDVGGGTGSLLAEILRARPEVRGTLVDVLRVVSRSGEVFEAAGVATSGDGRGAELLRPTAAWCRSVYLEERPWRLARSRGDGNPAPLCGSGATIGPVGRVHRGGARRRGIAGIADDGLGRWPGPYLG